MCAYIAHMDNLRFYMTPLCDRDVADEHAIMSMEGGMEVGESAVPDPSESRDESEIDTRTAT